MVPGLSVATGEPPRMMVRIGWTLGANVLRAGASFLTGIVIARSLGASKYGDLSFLLASTLSVASVLDFGTSSAFFTAMSRRRRSPLFLRLYLGWHAVQLFVPLIVIGVFLPSAVLDRLWVGQSREVVLLAFAATFLMNQTWAMLSQLAEARRRTAYAQAVTSVQALSHAALIAGAAWSGWLSVESVLVVLSLEYVLIAAVAGRRLLSDCTDHQRAERWPDILDEFVTFCRPLVLYTACSFLHAFADRWLLQRYGGSAQQGLFAVAQQFAAIGLVLTAALTKVFWKEVAEAQASGNVGRMAELYGVTTRMLFFAVAWVCCLAVPYSAEILAWTLGPAFAGGSAALAVMLLFPVHQALGQLQGSFFFATGDTAVYSRIGIIGMLLSIPAAYLMLAPRDGVVSGLGLGALGLALKLVVLQWIGIAFQSDAIARQHGWPRGYTYEIATIGILLVAAASCRWLAGAVVDLGGAGSRPLVAVLGATLYVALTGAFLRRTSVRRLFGIASLAPLRV
jgi:O-antigen/teichoic acid export membrane protein